MGNSFVKKETRRDRLRLILAGIQKHLAGVTSIMLGGVQVALADLTKQILADILASDASVQAKANLTRVVEAERTSHAALDPVLRLLKLFVLAQFGDAKDASATLADFGFTPRKVHKATVATKAEAVGKTRATREARHTMGTRQKEKVKGSAAAPGGTPAEPPVSPPAPTTPTKA